MVNPRKEIIKKHVKENRSKNQSIQHKNLTKRHLKSKRTLKRPKEKRDTKRFKLITEDILT